MGEGPDIFERAQLTIERRRARARQWRALAEVLRVPVLAAVALVAVLAWWLSGWVMWPWTIGLCALVVLAMLRVPRQAGPVWTLMLVVLAVDVAFMWWVSPWWWAILAGTVLTAAGTAAAIATRLHARRRETLAALAAGLVLLAGGIVGLAVTAAQERAVAARELQAAHDAAVPRILPRTPASMVNFLTERLAYLARAQHGTPVPGQPRAGDLRADICFVFAPAAQAQLAGALRVPDCPAAAGALARQVTPGRELAYTNDVWLPGNAIGRGPTEITVDACRLDFTPTLSDDAGTGAPGPQLGHLTLQQQAGEGHLVVAYAPCRLDH
ncbi:MAG TPA: hypothetical protein VG674_31945 [Amycolatopsis sp.]|nr:hypothetical protein [Amycolatopsis sp.]